LENPTIRPKLRPDAPRYRPLAIMRLPIILTLLLALASLATARVRVDGIAAKAHGEIVTMSELNIKLGPIQSVLMAQFPRKGPAYEAQLKEVRDTMLDELIDRAIIYGQFKDRIAAIPEHLVDQEVEKIVRNVYAGNEKLFNDYLRATGLTRAKFKEQQRKELLVQMVKSQHYGDLPPVTAAERNAEYAKWKIANRDREKDVATYQKIYIPKKNLLDPAATPEDQLELAESIVKQLKEGADFAELAKEHSVDAQASEGGLWEDVPRTDMSHEFGFVVFETKGHDLIGPLEDRNGYTIVKVKSRKLGPADPLSKVRDTIEKRVNDRKKKAEFDKWMKKVRSRKMVQKKI
ncbi:MAG: peptidylprolyl isomerase, partial [Verrucomicrobiales bacterium]